MNCFKMLRGDDKLKFHMYECMTSKYVLCIFYYLYVYLQAHTAEMYGFYLIFTILFVIKLFLLIRFLGMFAFCKYLY